MSGEIIIIPVTLKKKVTPVTAVGPDPAQGLVLDDFITGIGVTPGELAANTNIGPVVTKPKPPVATISDSSLAGLKVTKTNKTPPVNAPAPKQIIKKSKISKNPKTNQKVKKKSS